MKPGLFVTFLIAALATPAVYATEVASASDLEAVSSNASGATVAIELTDSVTVTTETASRWNTTTPVIKNGQITVSGDSSTNLIFNGVNGTSIGSDRTPVYLEYLTQSDTGTPNSLTVDGIGNLGFYNNNNTQVNGDASGYLYCAGAIYVGARASLTLTNNQNVTFSNVRASKGNNEYGSSSGGAISIGTGKGSSKTLAENALVISNNQAVTFSNDVASSMVTVYTANGRGAASGGAIGASSDRVELNGNASVTFSSCAAHAIQTPFYYSSGYYYITGQGAKGGAISTSGYLEMNGNTGAVLFSSNSSNAYAKESDSKGGAIYSNAEAGLSLSDNAGKVSFTGNYVRSIYRSYGGAIALETSNSRGYLKLNGNEGGVEFLNNRAYYDESTFKKMSSGTISHTSAAYLGGAIYSQESIQIIGNGDDVTFRGNYTKSHTGEVTLSSVYMKCQLMESTVYNNSGQTWVNPEFTLSAKEGTSINFYDALYVTNGRDTSSTQYMELSTEWNKADMETDGAAGTIRFSGKYAADDLAAVKGSAATATELAQSTTSLVFSTINLHGGTLAIEDDAALNTHAVNLVDGSNATLSLKDGMLMANAVSYKEQHYYKDDTHPWGAWTDGDEIVNNVTISSGSTLELSGANTIKANALVMDAGSQMVMSLGADNKNTAVLTVKLTELNDATNGLNLKLDGLGTADYAIYKLFTVSGWSETTDTSAWTADKLNITGDGYDAANLIWENGTLSYSKKPTSVTIDTTDTTTEGTAPTVSLDVNAAGDYVADLTVSEAATIATSSGANIVSDVGGKSKNFYNVTVEDKLTIASGNLEADNNLTVSTDASVTLGESVKLSGKKVNIDKAALHMTHGELEHTDTTTQGTINETAILGTGTISNVAITSSSMAVGNSPGVMTLSGDTVSDVALSVYFGTELVDALTSSADTVTLADNVTSGVVVEQGTTLSGTITLSVWNTDNDGTRTWDATAFTGTFTYGDSIQLISLGDGVDVSAVSGATYVIGEDLKNLLGEGLEWKVDVGSTGVSAYVTPEPATATLSLLALVGLCARRRRK